MSSIRFVAEGDVLAFPVELSFPQADDHNGLRYYRVVSVEPGDTEAAYYVNAVSTHVSLKVPSSRGSDDEAVIDVWLSGRHL